MFQMKVRSGVIVALIVILGSMIFFVQTAIAAPEPPDPEVVEVSINITQDILHACVEPPEERLTYVTGIVHVNAPYLPVNHRLILNLHYDARSARNEWFARGTEELYFAKDYSEKEFICTIEVPASTFVQDIGTLTVSGSWSITPNGGTGEATPDSARIDIIPYSLPLLEAYDDMILTDPGQKMECRVSLTNLGNGPDEFDLTCTCPEGTRIIVFPYGRIGLERGDTYRFAFTTLSNTSGSKEIKIIATGKFNGNYTPAVTYVVLAVSNDKVDVPFSHARFATFLVVSSLIILFVLIGIAYWIHRKNRLRSMKKGTEELEI